LGHPIRISLKPRISHDSDSL